MIALVWRLNRVVALPAQKEWGKKNKTTHPKCISVQDKSWNFAKCLLKASQISILPPPPELVPTAELQDVVATLPKLRKKLKKQQHSPLPRILNTAAKFWVSQNGQVQNHRLGAGVRQEKCEVRNASSSHPSQMDLICKAEEEGNFYCIWPSICKNHGRFASCICQGAIPVWW